MTTVKRQSIEGADSNRLATYLQSTAEREKSELTRRLHDDLGGLMVAALMDVAWTQTQFPEMTIEATEKLQRAGKYLSAAIDLSRQLIEDLRPTLLDNVGLFAALRWQMKHVCAAAGVKYSEHYPANEPRFPPSVAIGLFRFAQEALQLMDGGDLATFIALNVAIHDSMISVDIAYEGLANAITGRRDGPVLASMKNRIRELGGTLALIICPDNRWTVRASVPFEPAPGPTQ
jgi:signal transduction histidine kinase